MSEITEQNQDRLIIVIPAYNEEENIENVVAQWHPIVEKTGGDSRLFVINDGSTDRTQEELDHLQGKYPQLRTVKKENQGHGATILYGYRCAIAEGADYIFQTDSDGQTLPEEFWKLWEDRKKCGLLIGSRKRRQDGWQRIFVTRVLRLVILVTFHCWVEDANTPFRLNAGCRTGRSFNRDSTTVFSGKCTDDGAIYKRRTAGNVLSNYIPSATGWSQFHQYEKNCKNR